MSVRIVPPPGDSDGIVDVISMVSHLFSILFYVQFLSCFPIVQTVNN